MYVYISSYVSASLSTVGSEGEMVRLETPIELKSLNSSFSSPVIVFLKLDK